MSQTLEDLGDAITDALETNPVEDVLGVLCGSLVGLVRELTIRSGNDPEKTITLDAGPGRRKIEIHALPNTKLSGAATGDRHERRS